MKNKKNVGPQMKEIISYYQLEMHLNQSHGGWSIQLGYYIRKFGHGIQ